MGDVNRAENPDEKPTEQESLEQHDNSPPSPEQAARDADPEAKAAAKLGGKDGTRIPYSVQFGSVGSMRSQRYGVLPAFQC